MSCRITDDDNVALFDSTQGVAFGPIFESSDEAQDFLNWLEEKHDRGQTFMVGREEIYYLSDPRPYREIELAQAVINFRERYGD